MIIRRAALADAAQLTTGDYFAIILLALTPTSLGLALSDVINDPQIPQPTLADWQDAMHKRAAKDDPGTQTLLDALFPTPGKPVTPAQRVMARLLKSDPVSGSSVNLAAQMLPLIWNYNKDNPADFKTPWMNPPHPPGGSLSNLMSFLHPFRDK